MGINSYNETTVLGVGIGYNSTVSNPMANRDMGYVDRSVVSSNENPGEKYKTDYYAGCQVAIFMGDIWLSDISTIQYNATQNKKPFWGYKSKKFDLVAQGTQLIEGVFSMNYTHTNFLNMAVAKWREQSSPNNASLSVSEDQIAKFAGDLKNSSDPYLLSRLQYPASGFQENQNNVFNNLDNSAKQALLEQYFWGADDIKLVSQSVLQPDDLPPFDIAITFGNYPKNRLNPMATDEYISSHTVKAITGIHITSSSMQISDTGEPIQEVFTFIARSLDSPLTRIPKQFIS